MKPDEKAFETFICDHLMAEGGYDLVKVGNAQHQPTDFDPALGIDTAELYAFLGTTQADAWDQLKKAYGGDPDQAQAAFAKRLATEIDKRGTVDVLRAGVKDHGVVICRRRFGIGNA